jgi:hypothetical protein
MPSFSGISMLQLSGVKGAFGAIFPCSPKSYNSTTSQYKAYSVQCPVESSAGDFCNFQLTEQDLDMAAYSRSGMRFVEAIHDQYAKVLNNQRTLKKKFGASPLGSSLEYQIYPLMQGATLSIEGVWIVRERKLLRANVTCYPSTTTYMRDARKVFFRS